MNFDAQRETYKAMVEQALAALPFPGAPDLLRDAMRYSLLGGGKRLRGSLALAACEMGGGQPEAALPLACALEMIHAYSLIHDDLPAMDDDVLRRGKPTNHVVYGEAMAILAGDGLLTYAFEVLGGCDTPHALRAIREVAQAAGVSGMVAGQALDVSMEGEKPEKDLVERIHRGKTAALLTAPVTAGLALAGAPEQAIEAGREYGLHLGIAFQIVDDLLDLEGDAVLLGKTPGKDAATGKLTWPACVGVPQARQDAEKHVRAAVSALDTFGNKAEFLQALAIHTLHRVQ